MPDLSRDSKGGSCKYAGGMFEPPWLFPRKKRIPDEPPLLGNLAQLEEHSLDVRKVMGSSPLISTMQKSIRAGCFFCAFQRPFGAPAAGEHVSFAAKSHA